MTNSVASYLADMCGLTAALDWGTFEQVADELTRAAQQRRTVMLLGNGNSSAIADHFANDLAKSGGSRLTAGLGFGIRAVSLTGSVSFLTALANDISLDAMYREAIRTQASPGDLIIILTSGVPHNNVLEAARLGRQKGLRVVAVTGDEPGPLRETAHVVYSVPSAESDCVDDVHLFLCHCWTAALRNTLRQPVVMLDRDGVINVNRPDYVKNWSEFSFVPDAASAIRRLNEAGYAVVVVSNQSAVARGFIDGAELEHIHRNMCESLAEQGAWISKVYVCPHGPDEGCSCRKPKTGLIDKAFNELPLDPENAFLVGDHASDIAAGRARGLKTVFVANGRGQVAECGAGKPDFVSPNLSEAVEWILRRGGPPCES